MKPNNLGAWSTAAFLVAAGLLAGCMGPPMVNRPGEPGQAGEYTVSMQDAKYMPATLTVAVGSTVTWTNKDPVGHTVTPTDKALWGTDGSGDAQTKWLTKGQSWSFTFTKPGTFEYYCIPHAYKDASGKYNGMVAKVVVTGEAVSSAPAVTNRVVPTPQAPPPTGRLAPATLTVQLEANEVVAQLADGVAYEFWTFNGTVPGPMLRVREGDTVDFTLRNAAGSKHPHSIDFHAVTGPGGGAKATQTDPGKSTSFSFKALNPGLYAYHCATAHIPTHIANGMYGLVYVEPATPLPAVDREYFVVQGEVYTEGALGDPGLQAFSHSKMLDEDAEYFLLNGRVGALTGDGALTANVNETVRIFFGVGGFVPSSFHVIGEIFDRVFAEGSMGPPATNVQTTLVPAGGATIVDFKVQVPGDYILVDHWLTHAIDRGAVGILHVEGPPNPEVFSADTSGSGH
ncbi:MAG: nitrite reductase, copper-containing [Euryarchaeota archaeon]|nr:nitrite reductase, copper-containing [Euryarchaeota archaeon]